jgi:hypothetical protein
MKRRAARVLIAVLWGQGRVPMALVPPAGAPMRQDSGLSARSVTFAITYLRLALRPSFSVRFVAVKVLT